MTIVSKPEDGEQRTQEIVIDNARGRYELHETQDGRRIEQKLEGDTCAFSIDGSTDLTDKQLKKHRGGRSAFAAEPGLAHEQ